MAARICVRCPSASPRVLCAYHFCRRFPVCGSRPNSTTRAQCLPRLTMQPLIDSGSSAPCGALSFCGLVAVATFAFPGRLAQALYLCMHLSNGYASEPDRKVCDTQDIRGFDRCPHATAETRA